MPREVGRALGLLDSSLLDSSHPQLPLHSSLLDSSHPQLPLHSSLLDSNHPQLPLNSRLHLLLLLLLDSRPQLVVLLETLLPQVLDSPVLDSRLHLLQPLLDQLSPVLQLPPQVLQLLLESRHMVEMENQLESQQHPVPLLEKMKEVHLQRRSREATSMEAGCWAGQPQF